MQHMNKRLKLGDLVVASAEHLAVIDVDSRQGRSMMFMVHRGELGVVVREHPDRRHGASHARTSALSVIWFFKGRTLLTGLNYCGGAFADARIRRA